MPRLLLVTVALGAVSVVSCAAPVEESSPPGLDACAFERDVYPVLARDCGFPACHGNSERAFQVWAPGRARLDPTAFIFDPPTDEELLQTRSRAISMVAGDRDPTRSLLLRKPLEIDAGGAGHMGRDAAGRDVYADEESEGYLALRAWVTETSAACP